MQVLHEWRYGSHQFYKVLDMFNNGSFILAGDVL